MNKNEIILRRLYNSGLIHKFDSVDLVVSQLFGIQSQYLNHALFNIYNRTNAINNPIILGWGQRHTLHIYNLETWQTINTLLNQQTWVPKYYRQKGIDLDKEIEYFYQVVSNKDMLLSELKKYYPKKWSPVFDWSALLLELSRRGRLYITLDAKNKKHLHITEQIFGNVTNKKDVVNQFFERYGPATLDDLNHFFGTRKSFWQDKYLFDDLAQFEFDHQRYFYSKAQFPKIDMPEVILLGKFDSLLVAYHKKDILVPTAYHQCVWGAGGQISAIILVEGQFAGTWRFRMGQQNITYTISLIEVYHTSHIQDKISQELDIFGMRMNKKKISYQWQNLVI